MSQGFYGFPNILGLLRATTFKAIGKAGATNGAALAGGTASGAPSAPAGPFDVGDVIVDASGKLWICTTAGTSQSSPGSFTQVGGTTSPLSTKGDVWAYGSADSRLGVGSDTQVLTADSTQSLGLKWAAVAAGAGGAATQIGSTVLGASAATLATFSSIPATYTHLLLVVVARRDTSGQAAIGVRFNADSGANYRRQYHYAAAGSSGQASETGATLLSLGNALGSDATASHGGLGLLWLPFYAGTTFNKVGFGMHARFGGDPTVQVNGHHWDSTAAITTVSVVEGSGAHNFVAGSGASLYGIT